MYQNLSEARLYITWVYQIYNSIEYAPESFEFTVRISYFEIYMEKIRDLLCDGNDNLQIHENRERGVYVRHATELYMQSPVECFDVLNKGAYRRSTAYTSMNDQSSRSHAVVLLEIMQKDLAKGGSKTGKLYLVDLAGRCFLDNVAKPCATDPTLKLS